MGLDQCAVIKPRLESNLAADEDLADCEAIHYWRKHPNLHGWMENLYRERGGKEAQFNCASVRLTVEDLKALKTAVIERSLPHTTGFFFGTSHPEERERDLEFIEKAHQAIKDGFDVYYDSWW